MSTFGPFAFAAPLALLGLLALPVIWRLLRAAPPAPRRRVFAPWRLLADLFSDDDTHARTPWWLLLLRLTALALVCVGLARPIMNPAEAPQGDGPLLLVVDNGWAAAPAWDATRRAALARVDAAARDDRLVAVVLTAEPGVQVQLVEPRAARRQLEAARPRAWAPDRQGAQAALDAAILEARAPDRMTSEWLSDGLDYGDADAFGRRLAAMGPGRISGPAPGRAPLALGPPEPTSEGLSVDIVRAEGGVPRTGGVIALDADGRALARGLFEFTSDDTRVEAVLAAPLDVRNRMSVLRLENDASTGGARVLDDAWRRPDVGLVSLDGPDRQPLLADLHYVEKALEPYAEVRRASLRATLDRAPGVVILTDTGRILGPDVDELTRFVAEGGVLIRFAGPRLAARVDELTPVALRAGDRALGGALAWERPQTLSPFARTSPFFGLPIDPEITVSRQVLAEPTLDLAEKTWATLEDGTPLVTAERRGRGRIVLFHVTASPEWSNLPLSGVFVGMLRRTLAFAQARPTADEAASGPWRLDALLDADGRLVTPPANAPVLAADVFDAALVTSDAPAGRWIRGAAGGARNVLSPGEDLTPISQAPGGLVRAEATQDAPRALAGPLLLAALVFMTLDALGVMALGGRLRVGGRRRSSAKAAATTAPTTAAKTAAVAVSLASLLALGLSLPGPSALTSAHAQDAPPAASTATVNGVEEIDPAYALSALNELRLAYVITGDTQVDALSEAGLRGLSLQLARRTSIEPGAPLGVDIAKDPISLLPLLYWPVTLETPAPSPAVAARVDAYLKSGGVIIFDTQDAGAGSSFGARAHAGLARLADAVDMPPLTQIGEDHVLSKAFYLLTDYPGRWRDAPVWVEASARGSARDGVSSVIVTSADWSAAWAVDEDGRALAAVSSGSPRQREMAVRTGVNLVMYVLTGNYKADQVHIEPLLLRLGQ